MHVKGDSVRMIQEEGPVDIGQDFIHPSTGQLSGDCSSGETEIYLRESIYMFILENYRDAALCDSLDV